jgi:hypothetical protein
MFKHILYLFCLLSTILFVSCGNTLPNLKNQFRLQSDMIINESGCGYGTWVTDEQDGGEPKTFWDGYDKELCSEHQASLIISLGQKINIADLYIYSLNDTETSISSSSDLSNGEDSPISLKTGWNKVSLDKMASYIRIATKKGGKIGEILIDADKNYPSSSVSSTNMKKPAMDEFIGTNAFVDVPIGLLEPFGCVREYHDWPDWNEPDQDSIKLNVTNNGFNFQHFYTNLAKLNKMVVPVIQKSPQWLTDMQNRQAKPLKKNDNPVSPSSYNRHGYFMYRYADNFVKPENGQLRYFENWNEPDKWWEYEASYFTPYQYATMSSVDKDGDKQKMGDQFGIAKSGGKLVMAGLVNPRIDCLHALKHWCDVNRGGDFAWDVINYHQYANSCGLPDNKPIKGVCPEQGNIYETAKEIVGFRNKNAPNSEVWVTEFGYDTEDSPQQCPSIADKNSEMVQADWLIRSYLLLSATGVEKAYQFMIRDFGKSGLYATSGIYSSTLQSKPYIKPAWNYINTLRSALANSYFVKLKVDSINSIYEITYKNRTDTTLISTVIWQGTQEGKETKGYKLSTNPKNQARTINFLSNNACGSNRMLGKETSIDISETPIIIQEHPKGVFSKCNYLKPIEANVLKCTDEKGMNNRILVDEQASVGNPSMGIKGNSPATTWTSSYQKGQKEEMLIDLKSVKNIHSLYLFDGAGEGDITVSILSNSKWSEVMKVRMNLYNKWKPCVLNTKASKIKLARTIGNPDVGEIVIYQKLSE